MRSIVRTAVVCAAACLMFAGVASAAGDTVLEVKVPFPFMVGQKQFPAGAYTVERDALSPSLLLIRGEKATHASGYVLTDPAAGQDPAGEVPVLVFTRGENQYRLSTVWESGREGSSVIVR